MKYLHKPVQILLDKAGPAGKQLQHDQVVTKFLSRLFFPLVLSVVKTVLRELVLFALN